VRARFGSNTWLHISLFLKLSAHASALDAAISDKFERPDADISESVADGKRAL
jgi:hypothetical protein